MARVPLLDAEDLPADHRYLFEENDLGERNIFRALANNPRVLRSYMIYGSTLWEEAGLAPRERELVILAVARTLDSRYEWHQHVEIGRQAGLSAAEISAVGRRDWTAFSRRDRALLAYAEAVASGDVTDDDHETLRAVTDERTLTGTAMLAAYYQATATVLDALDVPPEDEFVGWSLD